MRLLDDIQQRILKEEYPDLHLDSDSDIERYFDLRQAGRQADALAIYNNRLRRKYPDDTMRARLLGYYRQRDPRFSLLLAENLVALADRLIARTRRIIELLTREIDTIDMRDAYSVIKLAEGLLEIISPDRYAAIAFTERYARYATLLKYRETSMARTAELVRLYVTDTIESVQDLKKTHEQKKRERARQASRQQAARPGFDLSRVVFSDQDVERILIPSSVTRIEDQVIAYCLKYWNKAADLTFEKTVFLYSRKYHTRHSDIFQAIKNGRMHNWKDEEILNAVLATVVTGYYYSISGDLYLQRSWAALKASGPAPAAPETTPTLPAPARRKKRRAVKKSVQNRNQQVKITATPPSSGQIPIPGKKDPGSKVAGTRSTVTVPKIPKRTTQSIPVIQRSVMPNSIADMIRQMTGKTYTVYRDLFFSGIRPSIRTVLSRVATRKTSIFDTRQNSAEELVYSYLDRQYSNPWQDWTNSAERKKLKEMGYEIESLEPIIEHWLSLQRQAE